jgi:hypothetical protein
MTTTEQERETGLTQLVDLLLNSHKPVPEGVCFFQSAHPLIDAQALIVRASKGLAEGF